MPTSVVRVTEMLRRLEEACQAASELRAQLEREMGSAHAREKPAKDDTAVVNARKTARKKP
jgi:hypothetical protein